MLALQQNIKDLQTKYDRSVKNLGIYSKMSERDLQAIYLYLSAIPHAEPGQ